MRSLFLALVAVSLCACTDGLTAPTSRDLPEVPTARLELTDSPDRTAALALIDSVLLTPDSALIIVDGVIRQPDGLLVISRDRVSHAELVRTTACALYGQQRIWLVLMVSTVDSPRGRK